MESVMELMRTNGIIKVHFPVLTFNRVLKLILFCHKHVLMRLGIQTTDHYTLLITDADHRHVTEQIKLLSHKNRTTTYLRFFYFLI